MMLTPEQWKSQTNDDEFYKFNTKSYALEWVYYYFGWNFRSPFLKTSGFVRRWAMPLIIRNYLKSIDRDGRSFHRNLSPHVTLGPKVALEAYQQDLDKAEELLAEAGWEDTDNDGILIISSNSITTLMALRKARRDDHLSLRF